MAEQPGARVCALSPLTSYVSQNYAKLNKITFRLTYTISSTTKTNKRMRNIIKGNVTSEGKEMVT